MQFGDDSSDEFSLMALTLPSDHMLIAEIRDETVSVAGTTRLTFFLSVTSDEELMVRSGRGELIWREESEVPMGVAELLGPDEGAQARAMADGHRLIEWLVAERYEVESTSLSGTSTNYGPFTADLDPSHRFVTGVRAKRNRWTRAVSLSAHLICERQDLWCAPRDADPARLRASLP